MKALFYKIGFALRGAHAGRVIGTLFALTLMAMGCGPTDSALSSAASTASTDSVPDRVEPLAVSPLDFFESHCSRCHGTYGSEYGKDFGEGKSFSDLRKTVAEMCKGPGEVPLKGKSLDALAAYHRSLVDRQPFVALTAVGAAAISGDVTYGSDIVAHLGGETLKGRITGTNWLIRFPEGTVAKDALRETRIVANLRGRKTELDLSRHTFSHANP